MATEQAESWEDHEVDEDTADVSSLTIADDAAPAAAEEAEEEEDEEEEDDEEEEEVVEEVAEVSMKQSKFFEDSRPHINVVFIGHVDAGKSTISGNILCLTGMVDKRTIEKYEREAKEKNRGTWFLAFVMDTSEEERAKGKTVEVGRAHFATEKIRYTILDAPGHKNYVPNMIGGAAQADVGILVVSARKGEFETGFDGGGQTREHATLAKTLGVNKLIVAVNKMDEPTVLWSKERYDKIVAEVKPFLKKLGYNTNKDKDVSFLPVSGYTSANIVERMSEDICSWYKGPCLVEALDLLDIGGRDPDGPLRIPVIDRYKEAGKTVILGKVESGTIRPGMTLTVMPEDKTMEVITVALDQGDVREAKPGENVKVRVGPTEEDKLHGGFVLSTPDDKCPSSRRFECQVVLMTLPPHKSIFSAGFQAVLHVHTCVEEVNCVEIISVINKKTKKAVKRPFCKSNDILNCILEVTQPIAVETFKTLPQLGRFTLRDEGRTIGIGRINKVL
eukprot:TRINITY_DN193_c0_g1_i1.p1 TRINITY_DN193_c0_g1~~TRINITY_DN193_c0_g1_i1.p1  ORF type:complete len:515 (+),score=163.00 TRINITY_DN193_c0_g1_i1:34-1545(+)